MKDNYKKLMIILMLILEITLVGVLIYTIAMNQESSFSDVKNTMNFCMAVIGIAITGWLGLNVYHIIEKSEFETLKNSILQAKREYECAIQDFHKHMSETNSKIEKTNLAFDEMNKDYELIRINVLQERIDLLIGTFELSNTWYPVFFHLSQLAEEHVTFEIYGVLIQIEKMYNQTYTYVKKEMIEEYFLFCKEGLQAIDVCKSLFINSDKSSNTTNMWYSIYLKIRESDFLYFLGQYYKEKNNDEYTSYFIKSLAILNHIDYLIVHEKLIPVNSEVLAKHYNTMAVSYIFLMDTKDVNFEEYRVEAIKYAKLSINTGCANAKAYRNYGVLLERDGMLDQAESMYRKSIQQNYREYKAYLCLSSLLLKQISQEFVKQNDDGSWYMVLDKKDTHRVESLKLKVFNIMMLIRSGICYAYDYADFHNKLGWCMSYQSLLEEDWDKIKELLHESEREFQIAENLKPTISNINHDRFDFISSYIYTRYANDKMHLVGRS